MSKTTTTEIASDITRQIRNPYLTHVHVPVRAYVEELDYNGTPGRRYYLENDETSIGRSRDASICLPHEDVSRIHARIVVREEEHIIHDNESRNGTFVGGTRVDECVLHSGDVLQIGPTLMRFAV